jgi:hypothetical protein
MLVVQGLKRVIVGLVLFLGWNYANAHRIDPFELFLQGELPVHSLPDWWGKVFFPGHIEEKNVHLTTCQDVLPGCTSPL